MTERKRIHAHDISYLLKLEFSRANINFTKRPIILCIKRWFPRRRDDNIPLISPFWTNNVIHTSITIPERGVAELCVRMIHSNGETKLKLGHDEFFWEDTVATCVVIEDNYLTKINLLPLSFIKSKTDFKYGLSSKYFDGSCATFL